MRVRQSIRVRWASSGRCSQCSWLRWGLRRLCVWAIGATLLPMFSQERPDTVWIRGGHSSAVESVAFSPDNTLVASGSGDGTVKLWRVSDGVLIRTLVGHTDLVYSVAFSPDGRMIASGSEDGTVRVWRVSDGMLVHTFTEHMGAIYSVAFSPDGRLLVSASADGSIRAWRVQDGASVRTFLGHDGAVFSVAFAPNGEWIASGGRDNLVRIWRVSDGRPVATLSGHTDWVADVAFSPDGRLLASGSEDCTIRIWRVADRALIGTLRGHSEPVYSVTFSPDGQQILSGSGDKTVRMWRVSDGGLMRLLTGHTDAVFSVAFAPDGNLLASGGVDNTIRVWRVSDGFSVNTLTAHTGEISAIAFSPDGALLASGSWDSTVRIWRASNGTLVRVLAAHADAVLSIAFSPDSNLLASGSWDATIRVWRVSDGVVVRTFTAHTDGVCSVAFSPDGNLLASGSWDGTLHVWRLSDGVLVRTLTGHADAVFSVAFSPDGRLLASAGGDGAIRFWRVDDGTLERVLTGHTSWVRHVAFSPDGRLLASAGGDGAIRLWQVPSGEAIAVLADHAGAVNSVAFSPEGRWLLSSGEDNTLRMWEVSSRSLIRTYSQETFAVRSVQFFPNGQWIGYGRSDATVVVARSPFEPATRPPNVPTPIAPSDGTTVSPTPVFQLRLSDADGERVKAVIEISTDSTVVRRLETDFVASGSDASVAVPTDQPLAAGSYTWRAQACDTAGNISAWSASFTLKVSDRVPQRLEGVRTFALSLRPSVSDPNALGLNGVSIVRWDAAAQQYAPATQLLFGEAYFIQVNTPVQPNLFGESIAEEMVLPLKPGWNLIANPTLMPFEWGLERVQVQHGSERKSLRQAQQAGWLEDYLWVWRQDPDDPARGQYQLVYDAAEMAGVASVLEPWHAYWILAHQECALVLSPTRGRAATPRQAPTRSAWTLQIEVAGEWGSSQAVWIGVVEGRSVRGAPAPAPPTREVPVQVRLCRSEGACAVDWRPSIARDTRWCIEVMVAPSLQPQLLTLRVRELMRLPRGVDLVLVDEQRGARRPLRAAAASLAFTAPAEGGVFRFTVEPLARRALLRVLNPTVRGGTRAGESLALGFTLTAEAQVQVQIRAGTRTVRTLGDPQMRRAGLQEFVWDGRDDAGVSLPPGTYLAEITAVSADGQIARTAVPILLRR